MGDDTLSQVALYHLYRKPPMPTFEVGRHKITQFQFLIENRLNIKYNLSQSTLFKNQRSVHFEKVETTFLLQTRCINRLRGRFLIAWLPPGDNPPGTQPPGTNHPKTQPHKDERLTFRRNSFIIARDKTNLY